MRIVNRVFGLKLLISRHVIAMDDFEEIRSVVDSIDTSADGNTDTTADTATATRSITITNSDPIVHLQNQINDMRAEVTDTKRIMNDLMGKITPLINIMTAERNRSVAKVEESNFFKMTPPDVRTEIDADTNSMVNISTTSSVVSDSNDNPFMTTPRNTKMNMMMSRNGLKSSSATASMGYVRNKDVWGTALGSLLIAAARYYIAKSGRDMVMIDEAAVVKNCITIMPAIYSATMHKRLPGVKDPTTTYLSNVISRMDKTDIPISDADTWVKMLKFTDGKDVMSIINNVIKYASLVPEAFVHPISQLITNLITPVARSINVENNPEPISIFAMSSGTNMSSTPNPWEVWCSILKADALVKYVNYRISGMKQPAVVAKMVSEMKESELTDKKNIDTLRNVAPFSMRRSDVSI